MWDLEQQKQLRTLPAYETLESLAILEDVTSLPGDIKPDSSSICVAVVGENGKKCTVLFSNLFTWLCKHILSVSIKHMTLFKLKLTHFTVCKI